MNRRLSLAVLLWGCTRATPATAPDAAAAAAPRRAVAVPAGLVAPVAARRPVSYQLHQVTHTDDYQWLREKGTAPVEAYLKAENAFTAAVMKATEPLQHTLYDEMLARLREDDTSVPAREGDWLYFRRTSHGQEHAVVLRKPAAGGPEEVLLDANQLRGKGDYLDICTWDVSDDGRLLAYAVDTQGNHECALRFKDLRTGQLLPDQVADVGSLSWAADNRTVFYTAPDPARRQYRLYRHQLGSLAADALLHEEKDERFELTVYRTRSKAHVVLSIESWTSTELRALDARKPNGPFAMVHPRQSEVRAALADRQGFYVLTLNDTGRNPRVVQVPLATPDPAHYRELVAASDDEPIEGADVFEQFMVLQQRRHGLRSLRSINFATGQQSPFTFPESQYAVSPAENYQANTHLYRYEYESMVTPPGIYERNLQTGEVALLKADQVPGYEGARFVQERVFATAADGVQIPISLAHRRDLPPGAPAPLYLEAYGAYGLSSEPEFHSAMVSLMNRGVIVGLAHVRGGGEFGKQWHDAGRMEHKEHTFSDFIACADELVRTGRTTPDRLVVYGASAGGLLVGAVLNQRPELFKAVVAEVPFVDVFNSMRDDTLPLTVREYEEWGNPALPADAARILGYSPYDNVAPRAYPDLLVTSSYHDSKVPYFESAKWVARLRANQTGAGVILLKVDLAPSGHSGKSGRYEALQDEAFVQAWVLTELGLTK